MAPGGVWRYGHGMNHSGKVTLVTDSAACLPHNLIVQHGVRVVPLHEDGTHTSRPSVSALYEAYREALEAGGEVLAVHLGSSLSGTIDHARRAAAMLNQECCPQSPAVRVVDSGVSSAALGYAVLAGAGGHDGRSAAALAMESAARSRVFFLLSDVSYLQRGGRAAQLRLTSTLGAHPLLDLHGGTMSVVETVRGQVRARRHLMSAAIRAACGYSPSGLPAVPRVRLAVHDSPAHDVSDRDSLACGGSLEAIRHERDHLLADLLAACQARGVEVVQSFATPIDAAQGLHVGPGALGIVIAPVLEGAPE